MSGSHILEGIAISFAKAIEASKSAELAREEVIRVEQELLSATMLRDQLMQHPYYHHHEQEWNEVATKREAASCQRRAAYRNRMAEYRARVADFQRVLAEAYDEYEKAWTEWEDRIEVRFPHS